MKPHKPNTLTAREKEIMQMLINDKLPKNITKKLRISIHTYYNHIQNINKKFGAKSIIKSVVNCIRQGEI